MAGPKKRGCLGCSFPVLIIVIVIGLGIVIIGLLSGAIGQNLMENYNIHINLPSWLIPEAPEPHLPAPVLFHVVGLPVTNTLIASLITLVFLSLFCWAVFRKAQLVPGRLQAAVEFLLGWIFDLCNSVAGDKNGRRFFPVVCTIFLFVLFNAWLALIPGFGSIKAGEHELIRAANTDVNTPLAIALVSFVFVAYFGLKDLGIGWLRQYFDFGPFFKAVRRTFKGKFSVMDFFSGAVAIFVGFLELLSRFITIISFTFRLFGNMTAGEILLLITAYLIPLFLPLPFYILELLIGFVQALIFAGLTLVFVSMAVTPHEHEQEAEAH